MSAIGGAVKKIAGETAVYGMSTIVARFVNFLFVSLYTYKLTTSDYGVLTEFMAYIAILQVILTMGLETGCFRYANKEGYDPSMVFSSAFSAVTAISAVFMLIMAVFGRDMAEWMGYGGHYNCYLYIGAILFSDSVTAVFFARLRYQSKAWKFAIFKTVKIFTEAGANLLLFLLFPAYAAAVPDTVLLNFVSPVPDFTYPVFAIFLSCIVSFLLFVPDMLRLRLRADGKTLKSLLAYSLPLMVAGLPGVMNDFIDRLLFRWLNVDDTLWRSELGIYQAAVKLSVIMSLFVQMFRYAYEPFIFARAKDRDSKEVYAKIMEYFTAFCMLIFLGVVFYLDVIQLILGGDFRQGVDIVPVMLLSYMLLGMLFNASIWYKLADRPSFAIYITLAGLAVTTLVNVIFLPLYSYHAAAWGHFASYSAMLLICVLAGRKYYPVPYNWKRIFLIMGSGVLLCAAVSLVTGEMPVFWRSAVRTAAILLYAAVYVLLEKHCKPSRI